MTAQPPPGRPDGADVDQINRLYIYLHHLDDCAVRHREPDCTCGLDKGITDQAKAIKAVQADNAALRAERARLKHLHELDHSLADQWQARNTELEADNAALRARAERAEAALREMDTASKSTNYESAAHKDLAIGRILSDALAAPTEPEGAA